jgi:hypothetical protein
MQQSLLESVRPAETGVQLLPGPELVEALVTETAIRLEDLIVAEDLRGKRVGRVMMNELQVLAANVPVSLGPDVATVHAMLTTISNGRPVDPTPAQYAALTSFDQWGHDACGFTRLDVTNTAAGLTGVPPALPAGTVSVSFTNRAPAAKAAGAFRLGLVCGVWDQAPPRNGLPGAPSLARILRRGVYCLGTSTGRLS